MTILMLKAGLMMSKPYLYDIWNAMHSRCYNTNHPKYHRYGGRGIIVCERWHYHANFVEDMGERPEGMTLERRNNDGNYEPDNCYWASYDDQFLNRSTTVMTKEIIAEAARLRNEGNSFQRVGDILGVSKHVAMRACKWADKTQDTTQ